MGYAEFYITSKQREKPQERKAWRLGKLEVLVSVF
jgi:hypothetical protein